MQNKNPNHRKRWGIFNVLENSKRNFRHAQNHWVLTFAWEQQTLNIRSPKGAGYQPSKQMKAGILLCALVFGMALSGCSQNTPGNAGQEMEGMESSAKYGKIENAELRKMCIDAGYEWMLMKPTDGGRMMKDSEDCWGCMVEG